jgi:hypothetical protein
LTTNEIWEFVRASPQYNFLRENPVLQDNIILLGLGGSYAYGTNNEDSDVDIRGIATNTKRNILTRKDFEQVVESETDTTIYSFEKMVKLLSQCNPNTIEILGLENDAYSRVTDLGRILLDNKTIFLSKIAVYSFGGYANAQLRRLENKAARTVSQAEQERHILKSIEHASVTYKERFLAFPEDAIRLYTDKAIQEGYETEIFMDVSLKHYPLRDYTEMWNEMQNIVKQYSRIGKRNEHAIARDKLGKHMMHLVRLYLMCFDILERHEIKTYRKDEHDFLMSIRNGEFLNNAGQPTEDFYAIVDDLEKRLNYDSENTDLPDRPNQNAIEELVYEVNSKVICKGK